MKHETRPITDAEVDRSTKILDHLCLTPVPVASDWADEPQSQKPSQAPAPTPSGAPQPHLTAAEHRLVHAVVEAPMRRSTEYVKLARMSPNKLQTTRSSLIERGFIREHLLESAGRGRPAKVLEPLEPAMQLVRENCANAGGGN